MILLNKTGERVQLTREDILILAGLVIAGQGRAVAVMQAGDRSDAAAMYARADQRADDLAAPDRGTRR